MTSLRRRCVDCDEDILQADITICNNCGSELVIIRNESSTNALEGELRSIRESFRDIFGDEIILALEEALGQLAPTRKVSQAYFDNLAKVSVDETKSILYDSYLEINGLKIATTIASFCKIDMNSKVSGSIVFGIPEYGEEPLVGEYLHSIVILSRGKISFVQKALEAQRVGASAVIVIQNVSKWPFVMTDSVNEQDSLGKVKIPIVMISMEDGTLLQSMTKSLQSSKKLSSLASATSSTLPTLEGSLCIGSNNLECIICREEYETNSVVVKLPCRHLYHHECLKVWVERNNTCPMCRHVMPT